MAIIETKDLRKVYRSIKKSPGILGSLKGLVTRQTQEFEAVKGINISLEPGELVGFLGPNGAGKTTTLKMLSGIMHPTSGSAQVLGFKPWDRSNELLRNISLVIGNKQQLWWDLPAYDSFEVLKVLYEVPDALFKQRIEFLCEELDLTDKIYTQVRKLSLGERMKCELVAALLYRAKVLFLDEPTLGLDVVSQKRIRQFLLKVNKEEGCTMLLTSHYMQDVEELCERVIVIDHGSVVFDGLISKLESEYADHRRVKLIFSSPVMREEVESLGEIVEWDDGYVVLDVPASETAQVAAAALSKLPIRDLAIDKVEIEEVIRGLFTKTTS